MEIKKVGVLGCGLMGSGIAQVCAMAGFDVTVLEVQQKYLDKGFAGIEKSLAKFAERPVEKGGITGQQKDAARARLKGTTNKSDLADCDIVIEAIIENVEEKKKIDASLDGVVKKDAIFASNTSSISVTEIDDVLEAKIASFFTTPSSDASIFFFSSTFSIMASITMSQSARSDLFVVPLRRARASSFCCPVMPPFSTGRSANFANDLSIPANPLSRYFCSTSSTVTSNPAIAQTCAMPEPISPQPRTPTFLISITLPKNPPRISRVLTDCFEPSSVEIRGLEVQQCLHNHRDALPAAEASRGQPILLLPQIGRASCRERV